MNEKQALDRLLSAKNYRGMCPDTVRREFEAQLMKRANPAAAEKAARERLHALSGAFMTPGEAAAARRYLKEYLSGDENALLRALACHASTRERAGILKEFYTRVMRCIDKADSVLDAACGLNPLYLGYAGFNNVLGLDINGSCADIINEWAQACGWSVSARCADVTLSVPDMHFDLALAMKLLPVMETSRKGSALELVKSINADYICVTFPTRTMGGRDVGMEQSYSSWFEQTINADYEIADRFVMENELAYVIKSGARRPNE